MAANPVALRALAGTEQQTDWGLHPRGGGHPHAPKTERKKERKRERERERTKGGPSLRGAS